MLRYADQLILALSDVGVSCLRITVFRRREEQRGWSVILLFERRSGTEAGMHRKDFK